MSRPYSKIFAFINLKIFLKSSSDYLSLYKLFRNENKLFIEVPMSVDLARNLLFLIYGFP
jgi:hypothetical protein